MAQNGDEKEDKFDAFTAEGEVLGYISSEQAGVLAMQHARDNRDFYGPAYSRVNLVWEVISQEEGEDYYDIRLSFRPAGRFVGEPGVEQFIIDKTGSIEIRQVLDEPTGLGQPTKRRPRLLLPSAVGMVVAAVVAVVAVFASGVIGGNGDNSGVVAPAPTALPKLSPTPGSISTPLPVGAVSTAWSDLDAQGCESEVALRSDDGPDTSLRFINSMGEQAQIYWLDYDGKRQFFQVLAPTQSYIQPTKVTHPWLVTNNEGECLGIFVSEKLPRTARLAGPTGTTDLILLAELKRLLPRRIEEAAPRLAESGVEELASAVLRDAQASGKTIFTPDEVKGFVTLAQEKLKGATAQVPEDASGQEFHLLLACIERSLQQCEVLQDFASAVFARTNGQLEIQVTSFPELGIADPDVLKLIADGKPQLAEVYGGLVTGDLPVLDLVELWVLFPDADALLKVLKVVREELHRRIEESSNGVVILENYYPGFHFFSTKPLQTPGDFKGLKIRSFGQTMTDLIDGLGAEAQFVALGEVPPALERGIIDAAAGTANLAFSLKWYEVSKFMVGPISPVGVTWLTMNRDQWNALPIGFQEIIREEAARHQEESLRLATSNWLKQGIQDNIDQGMEYTEFTPRLKNAFREAAISSVLPNWVKRVDGPGSPAVRLYNNQVAPIVGIKVNFDGTASEIRPRADAPVPTPSIAGETFRGMGVRQDEILYDFVGLPGE